MAITASMVKELRERTGAGMMECKKALTASNGDVDQAIDSLRKSGQAKAAKKAGRIAAEGIALIACTPDNKTAVIIEVNCETDFVAKDENFTSFAHIVAEKALNSGASDVEALLKLPLHEGEETTIEEARQALVNKIGENMHIRRFERHQAQGVLSHYQHGVRIGVLVDYTGGDAELGKDLAMHIAASHPVCVHPSDVPPEVLQKERDIITAQAKESGKPDNIVEKMTEGRIRKYLGEITLLGQPFVKDAEITVENLLKKKEAVVHHFIRFEVGEGVEKKVENFRDEVMAQAAMASK